MMPQPFVLAVPLGWNGSSAIAQCANLGRICADQPSLWTGPGTLTSALAGGGHVIGVLFKGDRLCPAIELARNPPACTTPAARARWLARECWGAYLAVGSDPDGAGVWAFPDPSGLLPVYRLVAGGHLLLTSDLRLLAGAGVAAPDIAWAAVADHLRFPEVRQTQTCLVGIEELAPGALHALNRPDLPPIQVWHPDAFMPGGSALCFADGAEALRACAIDTLNAWASLAGPVAVAASGGVDSSLICAALASAGRRFDCITLATADPSGDERAFAAALGDHLGARVVAAIYDPARGEPNAPASAGLPRPTRRTFMRALDAALEEARSELGANAVFDGNSGDNLFCFLHSAAPVLDRLAVEGVGPAVRTLLDMCHVTDCDAATMIGAAWRRWRRGLSRAAWRADTRLLAPAELAVPDMVPLTPWLDAPVCAHAGKRDHLALILRGQNHVHGLGDCGGARFSPLVSQPLVEFCLSVPTWLWCAGGINRALARQAFAAELPPAILRRRSKAGPDGFIRRLFVQNRPSIQMLLLEGLLAAQRVIDRAAVEEALQTDALSGDAIVNRLFELVEAELWARSWGR